jgi:hypothetical protein
MSIWKSRLVFELSEVKIEQLINNSYFMKKILLSLLATLLLFPTFIALTYAEAADLQ